MHARDPLALLPLTHLAYHILLALADDPRHGYGIISDSGTEASWRWYLALSGLRTRTVGAAITA
jgi:hypothetical protein